jgi:hydrogenase maturation protease
MLNKTLLLGYGNPDREDDGVGWHVLSRVYRALGRSPLPDLDEGFQPDGREPAFVFVLQLSPELAETLSKYERVAFIDAHTGQIPNEINLAPVEPGFQNSPFSHHMTPATLLSLAESLYGHAPQAVLLSVRGYEFGFAHHLSTRTNAYANHAARILQDWLDETLHD